ncbi:MAG: membrane protein insertion efficiency factor YidD [Peptococcaceae bacterium]|nr:membrane protein insertion efficiency factor YidD [Peptococcaceae bacterium]
MQSARLMLIYLIRLYQRTLSPDHGWFKHRHPLGYCRFQPTCSQYAIDAIYKYGAIRGGFKAGLRIIRCTPWSKGGWDPVK